MKTNTHISRCILAAGMLAVALNTASANILIDLVASSVDPSLGTLMPDGKTINVTGTAGT